MTNEKDMGESLSNENQQEANENQPVDETIDKSSEVELPKESESLVPDPESAEIVPEDKVESETQEAEIHEESETSVSETESTETVTEEDKIESETPVEKPEASQPETEVTTESTEESKSEESDEDNAGEDSDDGSEGLEQVDYSSLSKKELLEVASNLSKMDQHVKADRILKEIAPLFNQMISAARNQALEKFKADGSDAGDFSFRDEDQMIFDGYYKLVKERKGKYFAELEKNKEENYKKKLEVLEKLREFVDGEESNSSIDTLKALQEEWKTIGPIAGQHVQTLWANYHAIVDRFYDNRSIYFELKELDRKKNLKKKLVLCERAEELSKEPDFKKATAALNELHEEFKHIGPIPRSEQDAVWDRFKVASDVVYANRKDYLDQQKDVFEENLVKKVVLIEKLAPFKDFDSDRINDWNAKTKEILEIQKEWEAIGGVPRDKAKSVNKDFWGVFKGFFNDKGSFFKRLESLRDENLGKKNDLVAKADAIKDSTDWYKTSEELKRLQKDWKDIGPVPEKHRNEVYERFRSACDHFFNKKREVDNEAEKEFVVNLEKKKEICEQLVAISKSDTFESEKVYDLVDQFAELGFVPRRDIKSIKNQFDQSINELLKSAKALGDDEKEELRMNLQLSQIKGGPDASRKLNRKENTIKKRLSELEDNVSLWQNNLEFFANSKNADKLKADFETKIEKAKEDIIHLKKELKIIRQA